MKKTIAFLVLFMLFYASGQKGINVSHPKATLDIAAKDSTGTSTKVEGLLIPKVDRQRAHRMNNIPLSTLIYVNDSSTGARTGKAKNIDAEDFYYYDGTAWVKLGESSSSVQTLCNGFQGTYTQGAPVSGTPRYRVTIENKSFSPVTINFQASDLVLSGVSGLTVGTPTATGMSGGNVTIASGGQAVINYPITGTPGTNATLLTGTWKKNSLSCIETQHVTPTQTMVIAGNTKAWKRHNLGADTSLDPDIPVQGIHGNYYQWGRKDPVANASTPEGPIAGWDTTVPPNTAWQDGTKTANDPCPAGFKVPSLQQFVNLINNTTKTYIGTFTTSPSNFGSALVLTSGINKLTFPAAGSRNFQNGSSDGDRGSNGIYSSSTPMGSSSANTNQANILVITNNSANFLQEPWGKVAGYSVRCIEQ